MIYPTLSPRTVLFADDSLLLRQVDSPESCAANLNSDLSKISSWADQWLNTMNVTKTKTMIFSTKREKCDHPTLFMNDVPIELVSTHVHLGLTLSSNLSWRPHVPKLHQNATKKLNMLKPLKYKRIIYIQSYYS